MLQDFADEFVVFYSRDETKEEKFFLSAVYVDISRRFFFGVKFLASKLVAYYSFLLFTDFYPLSAAENDPGRRVSCVSDLKQDDIC
jgi:hypothetical protein